MKVMEEITGSSCLHKPSQADNTWYLVFLQTLNQYTTDTDTDTQHLPTYQMFHFTYTNIQALTLSGI